MSGTDNKCKRSSGRGHCDRSSLRKFYKRYCSCAEYRRQGVITVESLLFVNCLPCAYHIISSHSLILKNDIDTEEEMKAWRDEMCYTKLCGWEEIELKYQPRFDSKDHTFNNFSTGRYKTL